MTIGSPGQRKPIAPKKNQFVHDVNCDVFIVTNTDPIPIFSVSSRVHARDKKRELQNTRLPAKNSRN